MGENTLGECRWPESKGQSPESKEHSLEAEEPGQNSILEAPGMEDSRGGCANAQQC